MANKQRQPLPWETDMVRAELEKESLPPIYMLYDGYSVDGRGDPEYFGRTTSKSEARKFLDDHKNDTFWTGKIQVLTDSFIHFMYVDSPEWHWGMFPESEGRDAT